MRRLILGALFAASFALTGIFAASAAPVGPGLTAKAAQVGTLAQKIASGDYCSYMRYKCNHKSALGEWGEGNCRRYHQECGQVSHCERLRRACIYKEERGEEGQGNCRRYRYECGGRGY